MVIGAALLRMDEVLKFLRIADEENRRIVADQIVVAFLGVELECEAAGIADGICRSRFLGDRGKPCQHGRALAFLAQKIGFAPRRHVLGDLEEAVSASTLGVNHTFGDPFTVELSHLLDQVMVLQQDRTVWAGGKRMLVASSRNAGIGGRYWRFCIGHGDRANRRWALVGARVKNSLRSTMFRRVPKA